MERELKRGPIGQRFEKIYHVLNIILRYLLVVIMTVLTLVVFLNVMGRYLIHRSISWSEEISVFAMVWLVFFGGIQAFITDEHLRLDLLPNSLPPRAAALLDVVIDFAVLTASVILCWGGIRYINANLTWTSPVLQIPYSILRLPLPVCGIMLLILSAMKMIENIESLILYGKGDSE